MSEAHRDEVLSLEVAQHEVAGSLHHFDVDRRELLKILGGGVLVGICVPRVFAQESGRVSAPPEMPKELAAWLHIGADGRVTVYTGKVEVGQNIRTSLAQQVAEELRVTPDRIRMVMGDTDLVPWDMGTFGSRTTPNMGPQLKSAAAAARELLVDMAAERWKTSRAGLVAENGQIRDPASNRALAYGELTRGQKLVKTVGEGPAPAPPKEWKVAGSSLPKVGGRDFVTGRHRYTSDLVRPGMMHGKVLRPTSFEAKLVSLDAKRAEAMPGVRLVRDGDFVGVAAPDLSTAERALALLDAKWTEPSAPVSNVNLFAELKKNGAEPDRGMRHAVGSVEGGLASADVKLDREYTVEYIAHAPLEPRAAVAEWSDGRLTIWTGTQRPFDARDRLAEIFRLPPGKVRVIVPDTGSAYGGKHQPDAAIEAARLAKAAGRPVKVVWTREEEFTWAYFRPAGVIEVRSGARRDGALVVWEFHNYNSGPAAIRTPYDVPNQSIQFHPARSPLRQGSYRGLAAVANHFARESHMDEIAHAVKMDPLELRLKNLSDRRLRAVFEAAAERFGWGRKSASGTGHGIAGGIEKGSYVATCAEVEVGNGGRRVRIRRVVEAFDCGAVVNPDGVRNQIEGAIVQGIGGALFESIRFENGRIQNPHFSQYRVPRFPDVPQIEIVVLDRKDEPSAGAGETPIVGLAPAVAGAIFAATGTRLAGLPLARGLTEALRRRDPDGLASRTSPAPP
jgi:CO/xanthine dehydrogenase Mo-binding subunit